MGSGKKITVGYEYYLGMQMALCHGPIDKITRIQVDGRTAWEIEKPGGIGPGGIDDDVGTGRDGPLTIDARDLFGGEGREGGISGTVDLCMGYPGQAANAYLQSVLGSDIPAFRGVVCAVLNQVYMGNNPYLKPWSFTAHRLHVKSNGEAQWFDERVAVWPPGELPLREELICEYEVDAPIQETFYGHPGMNWENWTRNYTDTVPEDNADASSAMPHALLYDGWSTSDALIFKVDPGSGPYRFVPYGEAVLPENNKYSYQLQITTPDNVIHTFFPGDFDTPEQAVAAWGNVERSISGYTAYKMWFGRLAAGNPPSSAGNGSYLLYLVDRETDCIEIFPDGPDMNPAHIIRECLTDSTWGMGYSDSDIDDTAFRHAAEQLFEEGMGLSLMWQNESPIFEFVSEILRHIDGVLYVDRSSGKFVLKLVRDDYELIDLITLNETNVVSVNDAIRPAVGELVATVTISYWSFETGEDASITKHNQALFQIQAGGGGATTVSYPGITNKPLAECVLLRDLTALSTPLLSCQIEVGRIAEQLNIGDAFILDWPKLGINSLVMRVQQMSLGSAEKNTIVIDAVEDVFSLPSAAAAVTADNPPLWFDPIDSDPLPAYPRVAIEMPYGEVVRYIGQIAADAIESSDPDYGYILAAAGRQGNEARALLYVDSGTGYVDSGSLDFCPVAFLAGVLGYTTTTVPLTDTTDLDLVVVGTVAQIGDELVSVNSVDTGAPSITVGRGVLDTVPRRHEPDSDGIAVIFWGSSYDTDDVQYVASESVSVKLLPTLGANTLTLGDATADTVVMDSRATRPYPPGKLLLNGAAYPSSISGALTVTWAHRNRKSQADVLVDTTQSSVTPAANTRYTLQFYDATDTLIIDREDIGTPTADVVLDYTGDVTLKLFSVSDLGESLQSHEHTFAYTPPGGASSITATDYVPYLPTWEIDGNGG